MRRAALLLLPLLAGCVAPEEPVVRRPPRPTATAPLPANLEPAPTADRKLKAPTAPPVLQVEGLDKPKKTAPLPPL